MVLDGVNGWLWDLLSTLHLYDFFERHNIPPLIFPLALAAVIAAVFLLLAPHPVTLAAAQPEGVCGDAICLPGESCPSDCQHVATSHRIVLSVQQDVQDDLSRLMAEGVSLSVELRDARGDILESRKPPNPYDNFTFTGVTTDAVYLLLASSAGHRSVSDIINLTSAGDTIYVSFPLDFKPSKYPVPPETISNMSELAYIAPTGKTIVIPLDSSLVAYITENGTREPTVGLYDKDGNLLDSFTVTGLSNSVVFMNVGEDLVYVAVVLPNGTKGSSGMINLSSIGAQGSDPALNTLYLALPADFTETSDITVPPSQTTSGILARTVTCSMPGDFNGDGKLTADDCVLLKRYLAELQRTGLLPNNWIYCFDVNWDGWPTEEDYTCLVGLTTGEILKVSDCPTCEYTSDIEICRDGVDNNCDGQIDRDTYDNYAARLYGSSAQQQDICSCNAATPCSALRDVDGIPVLVSDVDQNLCAQITGYGGDYKWYSLSEWNCDESKSSWMLHCGGGEFECSWVKGAWAWRGI